MSKVTYHQISAWGSHFNIAYTELRSGITDGEKLREALTEAALTADLAIALISLRIPEEDEE